MSDGWPLWIHADTMRPAGTRWARCVSSDEEVGLLADLERADAASPAARLARRRASRLRACLPAAAGRRGTRSLRRMRSVSSATRITSNRSLVLLSVPLAIGQPAARSAGIGGMTPRFAAIAAWCDTMVPRPAEQRDVGVVDVAAVRREQPRTEEAVPVEKRRRAEAVVPHHELDFGAALRQVDRVAEIVFLGEGADRLQQFGRRGLGERGGREHADASLLRAVPRA